MYDVPRFFLLRAVAHYVGFDATALLYYECHMCGLAHRSGAPRITRRQRVPLLLQFQRHAGAEQSQLVVHGRCSPAYGMAAYIVMSLHLSLPLS